MYFEAEGAGVLIEAKDLVNGVSIVQLERADKVEYIHIELDTHDVTRRPTRSRLASSASRCRPRRPSIARDNSGHAAVPHAA